MINQDLKQQSSEKKSSTPKPNPKKTAAEKGKNTKVRFAIGNEIVKPEKIAKKPNGIIKTRKNPLKSTHRGMGLKKQVSFMSGVSGYSCGESFEVINEVVEVESEEEKHEVVEAESEEEINIKIN